MISAISTLPALAVHGAWAGVLVYLAKLTLIAALGHAILTLGSRSSAARRHLAATVALAALLALPAATALLPAWRLPILPARPVERVRTLPAPMPRVFEPIQPIAVTVPDAFQATRPVRAASLASVAASQPARDRVMPAVATTPAPGRPIDVAALAWLAFLGVAIALLARLLLSLLAAASVSRRGEDVRDPLLLREFRRARAELDIREHVRLRFSASVGVPVVSGLLRPTLLLPPEATGWSRERLRIVFMHELAHVRRHDAATLVIARAATALCWFHPLAWTLAREARHECERACDDLVLGSGVRASAYAQHLVSIARAAVSGRPFAPAALAIARRSNLEGRVVSILRLDAARGPASWRGVVGACALSLLLLLPLASVRVVAANASSRHAATPATPSTPATPETACNPDDPACPACDSDDPAATEPAVPAVEAVEAATDAPDANGDILAWNEVEHPDRRSGDAWWSRAKELYDSERYAQAGQAYENAAEHGKRTETALYNAACSYALAHMTNRALGALVKAIDSGFDDWEMIASDTDLNSLRTDRRFQMVLDNVMHTDAAESAKRSAVERYESLRGRSDSDADDWREVGVTLMRIGEHDRSIEAFRTQYRKDSSATALYNLACAQALAGDHGAALTSLERSVRGGYGDPDHMTSDPDLMSLHGEARFASAVDLAGDLSLSVDGNDDNSTAWRRELGRFQRVADKHPEMGRAWFNLGYAQLRAKQPREAFASFGRALDLGYRTPTTLYNLACSAAQSGDKDTAFEYLDRAEQSGMEIGNYLGSDRDLFPLRSDRRFQAMLDRVDGKWGFGWHDKSKHKDKSKDQDEDR